VLMAMIAVAIAREILNPVRRPSFLRFALGPAEFRAIGGLIALFFLMIIFVVILVIVSMVIGFVANALLPAAGRQGRRARRV